MVDDVHLLDEGSAALVHQLVQTASCSVIASVRIPGTAPDPLTALWKDGLAERIDLHPLSESEVDQLATGVLGGPVAGASVRRLFAASGGNALYIRELLRGAAESGALSDDGGMWMLRMPLTASERLVELVASRLADLPAAVEDVLDLLAVGEPLGLSLLESLGRSGALEDAERQDLIEVSEIHGELEVRLAHPIYGEVLRQKLPRTGLRRLWATLAEALEATGSQRSQDVLHVAALAARRWRTR